MKDKLFINELDRFTKDDYINAIMGKPLPHNDVACKALLEYEQAYDEFDRLNYEQIPSRHGGTTNGRKLHNFIIGRPPRISEIAAKYGITVEDMKKHRKCMPKEYGYS